MRLRKRLIAAFTLAALCAPGTWLRTDVPLRIPTAIALSQVEGPADLAQRGWSLGGIWRYSTEPNRYFGGFSALVSFGPNAFRAFSDRGMRFTFFRPDHLKENAQNRQLARQLVSDPALRWELWDIESATRDPETGTYWLGYESLHTIQRFSVASASQSRRDLSNEVDWSNNSGAEAMVRLADGRFIVIGEGQDEALVFSDDPAEGAEAFTVPFVTPAPDYAVTDMTQLPDGRIMLLMRNVVWGYPPFECLIAIGPAPESGASKGASRAWAPTVALRFDDVLPNENYEGVAAYGLPDGQIEVWVMSDDNFSVMQRTLLVKLLFDPKAGG